MNLLQLIFMSSCQFILLPFKWSPQHLVLKLLQLTYTGLSYGLCHIFSCLQSRAIHPEDGGSMSLQIQCKDAEDIHLVSHILRVVQLQTQSHTWPMCWYVWFTINKSKCQFYNRVLQEGCNVHDRLWNSTVMCKNLTAWTLPYPLPFGVKNSQFPSTMGYVNIFKSVNKILSSVTHHIRKTTKPHAVNPTTTNTVSTYPIIWRK